MPKQAPLKFRLISERCIQGIVGQAGERVFVLCLSTGQHATLSINESVEFKALAELPRNLADEIRISPCDCGRHPETAPPWLTEALIGIREANQAIKRSRAKAKKRPTMGAKRS